MCLDNEPPLSARTDVAPSPTMMALGHSGKMESGRLCKSARCYQSVAALRSLPLSPFHLIALRVADGNGDAGKTSRLIAGQTGGGGGGERAYPLLSRRRRRRLNLLFGPGRSPKLMAACCFGREAETDLSRAIRHSHLPFIHKRLFLALVRMINITVSLFSPVELSTDDTDSLTAKLSHALLLTWTS